ncbi:MAG: DNA-binding protein [Desulfofundulus sp.]
MSAELVQEAVKAAVRESRSMKANRLRLEDAPDFFGPRELGRIMGINEKAAYALAHSKGFPVLRVGKKLLISKMGLIKWLGRQGLA